MTDEEKQKWLRRAVVGDDTFEPVIDRYRNMPREQREKLLPYLTIDDRDPTNLGVIEPSEKDVFSVLTSTVSDELAPSIGGAIAGSAVARAATPAITGFSGPGAAWLVPALNVAAPLAGGVVGGIAGETYRDAGKSDLRKEVEQKQREFFKETSPLKYYLGKLAAQAVSFRAPGVDALTGAAKLAGNLVRPTAAKAITAAEREAVRDVGISSAISAGTTLGAQAWGTGNVDFKEALIETALGAAGGKLRTPQAATANTLAVGAQNIKRWHDGRPMLRVRRGTDGDGGIIPGSAVGALANDSPVAAQAVLNREAIKRNLLGLGQTAVRDLAEGRNFSEVYPALANQYRGILGTAAQKMRRAYLAGYEPEFREIAARHEEALNDYQQLKTERDNITAGQPADVLKAADDALAYAQARLATADAERTAYTRSGERLYVDPGLTPEEEMAVLPWRNYLDQTRHIVRQGNTGNTAGANPNYWPEQLNTDYVKQLDNISPGPLRNAAFDELLRSVTGPEQRAFVEGQGGQYDEADARRHFEGLFTTAGGRRVTETGRDPRDNFDNAHEFGAIMEARRRYSLLHTADPDPLRTLERYAAKFADSESFALAFQDPGVRATLGFQTGRAPGGRGSQFSSKIGQRIKSIMTQQQKPSDWQTAQTALQRIANSSAMQLKTGVINYVEGFGKSMTDVIGPRSGWAVIRGNVEAITDWSRTREAAFRQGVVKNNNNDFVFAADEQLARDVATGMDTIGDVVKTGTDAVSRLSLSNLAETTGRVRDFAVGRNLAVLNARLAADGDAVAQDWINKHRAGTNLGSAPEEAINQMAANYVVRQQTSYGIEDLPAWLVEHPENVMQGGAQFMTRMSRYGISTLLRVHKDVMSPAERGDARPLLALVTASVLGKPLVQGLKNLGRTAKTDEDEDRLAEIYASVPENMQGIEKTLEFMEGLEAVGNMGVLGNLMTTAAKRAKGQDFDYFGNPTIGAVGGGVDILAELGTTMQAGGDLGYASKEIFKKFLVNSMQNIRVAHNELFMSRDEKLRRGDVQRKREYERVTGPAYNAGSVLANMLVPLPRYSASMGANEFSDALTNEEGPTDAQLRTLEENLTPQRKKQQVSRAQESDQFPADPRKANEYKAFLLRVYGKEALAAAEKRDAQMRRQVVRRLDQGLDQLPSQGGR